jgi:type II secretory pathway pseudopilin PulG
MADQEMLNFIKQRLTANVSREALEKELHIQGYSDQEISEAFAATAVDMAVPAVSASAISTMTAVPLTSQSSQVVNQINPTTGSLPNFSALLSSAVSILKDRPGTLFGIAAIAALPQEIPGLIALAFGGSAAWIYSLGIPLLILVVLVYTVVSLVTYVWGAVAILYAIKDRAERIGISESFARSRNMIGSWVWVNVLTSAAVFAGFILFIIPGIIFGIWFSFAAIVLIAENIRGTQALSKSKEYVKGHVDEIFTRFFLLGLLYIPFYIVIAIVSVVATHLGPVGTVLQQIVGFASSLIYIPLGLAFQFVLYENLRSLQGTPQTKKSVASVIFMVIVGLLFAVALIGIIASVALASLSTAKEKGRDARRISDTKELQLALELYSDEHNVYPVSLDQLVPEGDIENVPVDPTTAVPYQYQVGANDLSYQLCATLEENAATSTFGDLATGGTFTNGEYCMSDSLSDATTSTSARDTATTTQTQ